MLTTRAQLHDLIDRLPDYAFGGGHGPAAQPPEEIIRALRDLTDMTKALLSSRGRSLKAGSAWARRTSCSADIARRQTTHSPSPARRPGSSCAAGDSWLCAVDGRGVPLDLRVCSKQ